MQSRRTRILLTVLVVASLTMVILSLREIVRAHV